MFFFWCSYVSHFSVVDNPVPCSAVHMFFGIIFTILAWTHPWSHVNEQQSVLCSFWTATILLPRAICDLTRHKYMEILKVLLILWKDFSWNPFCVLERSCQYLCTCAGFAVDCHAVSACFMLSEIYLWKVSLCHCWTYAEYCRYSTYQTSCLSVYNRRVHTRAVS